MVQKIVFKTEGSAKGAKSNAKSDIFFSRKPNLSISFLFAHSSKNSLRYSLEVKVSLIEFTTLVLFTTQISKEV